MSETERIKKANEAYLEGMPTITCERAQIWTESFKKTEGEHISIRSAKAFYDTCDKITVKIFEGELIVGVNGEFRRGAILTPEASWKWIDAEMDNFDKRKQDPYVITHEQCDLLREEIFPYWRGKTLEEYYISQIPDKTRKLVLDTGILDNDMKWRQAGCGENTPDFQDVLFKKGFKGIIEEAEQKLSEIEDITLEEIERTVFYKSIILTSKGIIRLANRYADEARIAAKAEKDEKRKRELLVIAENCSKVPENPPTSFYEALQFVWFVQLGVILSENSTANNLGRFDQYMYPYFKSDIEKGVLTEDSALELIEALWIKLSEWVWTVSANTAEYVPGYNSFQSMTVGGKTREGLDASNELTYLCIKATQDIKTTQPSLGVRLDQDSPDKLVDAVTELVSKGTGFPAIYNDQAGYQMLRNAGYEAEDARDFSNCGCIVPHFRKASGLTSAITLNIVSALEFALNEGKSIITDEFLGLEEKKVEEFASYEEVEQAFFRQFANLCKHSVIATQLVLKLFQEMVPRPFLSSLNEGCMEKGKNLSNGGAKYQLGSVITGIGLAVAANSLAAIKKLVYEDHICDMATLHQALLNNWEGYEELRECALAVPKYGNNDDYVDDIAVKIANFQYNEAQKYEDLYGKKFNIAYMGITSYMPAGKIVGATPCGRKAKEPTSEGLSPFAGSDTSTPIAAMRSVGKISHDICAGGTLLNLRIGQEMVNTKRGQANLGAMIKSYFALGAFHVQFNTVSNDVLYAAQREPEKYKDLLVRVAGYSAHFTKLSKEIQDAIIARCEHENY